jgi:hypothetical protein
MKPIGEHLPLLGRCRRGGPDVLDVGLALPSQDAGFGLRSQRMMPVQPVLLFVLLFVLAEQLASLSIDEVQLGASEASDPFIFVPRTCTPRRAGLAEGLRRSVLMFGRVRSRIEPSIILTLLRADGSGTLQVSGPVPGF